MISVQFPVGYPAQSVQCPYRVIPPEVAYQIRSMLRGVVTSGTAKKARGLPGFIAGKTGTTNEYRDAWFIGFTDDLIMGLWVGRDDNKQMGYRASGGTAALPIWIKIMKTWLSRRAGSGRGGDRAGGSPPPGVSLVRIDARTGLLPSGECPGGTLTEAFVQGTEPTERCRANGNGRGLFR